MRVLIINEVCGTGSTGRIAAQIALDEEKKGNEVRIAYGRDLYVPEDYRRFAVRIGNDLDVRIHGALTRLFDIHGTAPASRRATKRFLRWAGEYEPDFVWLHNLHGYYINFELLFAWLKKRQKQRQDAGKPLMVIRWTLHDCWSFTGHCAHFTAAGCERWKTGCQPVCPEKRRYPASLLYDGCARNYALKKAAFTGVAGLQLITPSQWLAGLVKQSFLKEYPVEVVYNTIDTTVFKPTPSDFRERNGLTDKRILLGVATAWTERKGLGDYIRLAEELAGREGQRTQTVILLVGIDPTGKIARSIIKRLSEAAAKRVILLNRTNNARELAEIYTAADVCLNLSKEETFGLTSLESIACGTPTVVYRGTACEEVVEHAGDLLDPEKHTVIKGIDQVIRSSRIIEKLSDLNITSIDHVGV